jgi:PKD repeat protein
MIIRHLFLSFLLISSIVSLSQPIVNFTVNKSSACVGDTITMTSTSTSTLPITNYIWSAQGAINESGQGANLSSFSFVYSTPGTYTLGLIVTDQNGQSAQKSMFDAITIHPKPNATIVSSIISCTNPFEINYNSTGSATGANIQYLWQFPSGLPLSHSGPQKNVTYNQEGNVTSTLKVTNTTTGCFSIATKTILLENFQADFNIPTDLCKGKATQLTNTSSSSATSYVWTSNSGLFSSTQAQNPTVTFNLSGNFTITLTATNQSGCTDSETKTITVHDLPPVSYAYSENFGCAPKIINFTNTSGNPSYTYTWDFNDQTSNFTGFTPPPHTYYQNNRLFFPKLTVTDNNGCVNSFVGDTIYFFPPEAQFSATPPYGCAPITVQFTDQSYSHEPIVSWFWDFGDGTTSTLQNPNHTFPCGVFDVKLVIVNQNGCIDSTKMSHQELNLLNGGVTTVSDVVNVVANHQNQTIFRVKLNQTFNDFQYSTIRFGELMSTDFSIEKKVICSNEPLKLLANVPNCVPDLDIFYQWTLEGFGNYSSITPDFEYVFSDTSRTNSPIDIGLTIDYRGCVSPITIKIDSVYIKGPVSRFMVSPNICNEGSGPHAVQINDLASIYGHTNSVLFDGNIVVQSQANDDVEVTYNWGDGTQTTITNDSELEDANKGSTSHVYNEYGTFQIVQIITNHTNQCRDTSFHNFSVSYVDGSVFIDSVCLYSNYKLDFNANSSHFPVSFNISNSSNTFSGSVSNSETIIFPQSDSYFVANSPGNETITFSVTNEFGCSYTSSKQLITLNLPISNITFTEDTVCKNSTSYLSPIGSTLGDINSWASFEWFDKDTNLIQITTNFDSIPFEVGNKLEVLLKVTDSFGCSSLDYDKITIYTQNILANFTTKQYLCNDIDELLDASNSIGIGNLTYKWYLDGNFIEENQEALFYNTITVNPPNLLLSNHNYALVVEDSKGCTDSISKTVMVSNPRITNVDTTIFATYVDINGNFTCPPVVVNFSLDYQTNFTASNYQWSFGNDFDEDFDSQNAQPSGIQYVQAGNYNLIVQMTESVTGCVFQYRQNDFLVIGGPKAEIRIIPAPNDICGMSYLFEVINPSENLDRWDWNLGDGTIEASENHPSNSFVHTYLDIQDFQPIITIYDDSLQCAVPITILFDMVENGLDAFFTIYPSEVVQDLNIIVVDGSTSTEAPIVTWVWDFGDGDSTINNSNINAHHTYLNQESQQITLTIIDANGCTDQYSIPISIFKVNFEIPNIITNPGAGGENSYFTLFTDIFSSFQITIVNRWGNKVHIGEKDPLNPLLLWNGLDYLTNNPCVDGVYYYILEGILKNGKQIKHQDFLTIAGSKNSSY